MGKVPCWLCRPCLARRQGCPFAAAAALIGLVYRILLLSSRAQHRGGISSIRVVRQESEALAVGTSSWRTISWYPLADPETAQASLGPRRHSTSPGRLLSLLRAGAPKGFKAGRSDLSSGPMPPTWGDLIQLLDRTVEHRAAITHPGFSRVQAAATCAHSVLWVDPHWHLCQCNYVRDTLRHYSPMTRALSVGLCTQSCCVSSRTSACLDLGLLCTFGLRAASAELSAGPSV